MTNHQYQILELDLSTARTDKQYAVVGQSLTAIYYDGKDVTIKLDSLSSDAIPLDLIKSIKNVRFEKIYITNEAQSTKELILGFNIEAETHSLSRVFYAYRLDEDGSAAIFESSETKTGTPTKGLISSVYPVKTHTGKINRIHYKLTPTNAVTYTLRIWRGAIAANEQSNMYMLYESPAGQVSATDYDEPELNIPFKLIAPSTMYFSIEWSAAPGTTIGFIEVTGERFE